MSEGNIVNLYGMFEDKETSKISKNSLEEIISEIDRLIKLEIKCINKVQKRGFLWEIYTHEVILN